MAARQETSEAFFQLSPCGQRKLSGDIDITDMSLSLIHGTEVMHLFFRPFT
jgi:hypothetical protein